MPLIDTDDDEDDLLLLRGRGNLMVGYVCFAMSTLLMSTLLPPWATYFQVGFRLRADFEIMDRCPNANESRRELIDQCW